jgi:nucleotide-binding universal stress UspA family protein
VFKTIVIGLDGSEGSKRAIPLAGELAARDGAKIVVAHVDEVVAARASGPIHAPDEEQQRREIRQQADELARQGIETDVRMVNVMEGPAHAIAEIARDADADLIVVGTRGRSRVTGLLLGSGTQRLLHIAHCPVLAVPATD